ncbi:MAG TPA: metallophosphoesterase [Hyphomicrobiales bacterium]|nr:metallophosphoesterase [Hyphomicrobiales bacterium]
MISRRHFISLSSATAGAAVLGTADAFALEPRFRLVVKKWTVKAASWSAAVPALRIGILSDIHAVEPWMSAQRIGAIVTRLNALEPDVIVLLGDYVNALRPRFYSSSVPVNEWVAALSDLRAPHGVHAVLGNHDWWSGEAPAIRIAFEKAGIHLLENSAVEVRSGHHSYWLAGLMDQLNYNSRGEQDVRDTLSKIAGSGPVIFLAHEPDIFVHVPSMVALTLAGHTHGGQVYIPFIGRPVLERQPFRGCGKYAYGHFDEGGRHMVVSSGLGLSHLPVRFLVPPEIAIVTLGSIEA